MEKIQEIEISNKVNLKPNCKSWFRKDRAKLLFAQFSLVWKHNSWLLKYRRQGNVVLEAACSREEAQRSRGAIVSLWYDPKRELESIFIICNSPSSSRSVGVIFARTSPGKRLQCNIQWFAAHLVV